MEQRPTVATLVLLVCSIAAPAIRAEQIDYESPPISYSESKPENPVSELQTRQSTGGTTLKPEGPQRYLKSLLQELQIPVSSQVLVFSKTSLQAHHISPRTPRAIYFNDHVHVGYVQNGLIEIAAADARLGMVFYTIDQSDEPTTIIRKSNNCLNCHGSTRTRGVPGALVRSVFPAPNGQPVIAAGSFLSTHTSPFEKRWGGWYVTGTHGGQRHLGNFTLPSERKTDRIENVSGQNVTSLAERFDVTPYLSPHSDIVALMVLEHQADGHNLITKAGYETRHALWEMERQTSEGATSAPTAQSIARKRIEAAADPLVKHFLFSQETKLTEPIRGTSAFSNEFAERGPRDKRGRSLRDFDLNSRLFQYPCSYLIYSASFESLPIEMKAAVYRRLREVLNTGETSADFAHLSAEDRTAIREILQETKPDFSDF